MAPVFFPDTPCWSIWGYHLRDVPLRPPEDAMTALMVVDTHGSHWLSTCPSSRVAFMKCHTAVNYGIHTVLPGAEYTSTLSRRF